MSITYILPWIKSSKLSLGTATTHDIMGLLVGSYTVWLYLANSNTFRTELSSYSPPNRLSITLVMSSPWSFTCFCTWHCLGMIGSRLLINSRRRIPKLYTSHLTVTIFDIMHLCLGRKYYICLIILRILQFLIKLWNLRWETYVFWVDVTIHTARRCACCFIVATESSSYAHIRYLSLQVFS